MNDLVNATARAVVTAASAIQLSLAETIFLSPGSPAQFIHQDDMAFDLFPFGAALGTPETRVEIKAMARA